MQNLNSTIHSLKFEGIWGIFYAKFEFHDSLVEVSVEFLMQKLNSTIRPLKFEGIWGIFYAKVEFHDLPV